MRTKLDETLKDIGRSVGPTLNRFWVSVVLSVALTTTLINGVTGHSSEETLGKLSLALGAGLLVSWCAVLFWETLKEATGDPLGGSLLAALAATGTTWATYTMLQGLGFIAVSRHVGILLFLFLLFFLIPHIRKDHGLDMYIVRLFLVAATAVLFSAVLFAGLAIIIFTVTSLFSLEISGYAYLKLWLAMAGVVAPFLFMAGIPAHGEVIDKREYPPVLRSLMLYVITPLVTAYTGILYLYFAKILVTRQWPVGVVAHLVLWYSVATAAAFFFIWPLSKQSDWAKRFPSRFAKAVLPLLAMMFVSIGIRIKGYGVTENRYYVIALGLWLLFSMVYLALAKDKPRKWVLLASLAVVTLVSVFGPVSSFSIAKESQNKRLENLIAPYGALPLPETTDIPNKDRQEIVAILDYFNLFHSFEDVRVLPEGFRWANLENVFGFSRPGYLYEEHPKSLHYEGQNRSFDISGYDYLFDFSQLKSGYRPDPDLPGGQVRLTQGNVQVTYDVNYASLSVAVGGVTKWETTVVELLKSADLGQQDDWGDIVLRAEDMVFEREAENLDIIVVIQDLWAEAQTSSDTELYDITVHRAGFYVLIRQP